MHVETPAAQSGTESGIVPKIKSLKRFSGEYVMIVVSIVTALAFENGVRYLHQTREAREAARNLDAEIAVNLAELRSTMLDNEAEIERLGHLRNVLLTDIRAGASDKDTLNHVMTESKKRFNVTFTTPTLQREAWDVAVANQALSNLELKEISPQDLYRAFTQMSFVHESNLGNMRTLEKLLRDRQGHPVKP